MALIGAGARGTVLAGYMAKHVEVELRAVVDVDAERSRRFCQQFNPGAVAVPVEHLLRLNVDAWVVATPDASHGHYARLSFDRNVHLLCEKPIGISLSELDDLESSLEQCDNDRVVMSAFVLRHHRFYQRLRELVAELGVIRHVAIHDLLWGSYMFRRWHRLRIATGGPVAHEGVHSLDQLTIMGFEQLRCEMASADRAWFVPRPGVGPVCSECVIRDSCTEYFDAASDPLRHLYETPRKQEGYARDLCVFNAMADVEDLVTARLRSASGAVVDYSLCLFSTDQSRRFTFLGTEGTVVADEASGQLVLSTRRTARCVIQIPKAAGLYGGSDEAMFGRFVERIMLRQVGGEDFSQALQSSRMALGIESTLASSAVAAV
ncbi:MAG: Gfo/Idh/MocA family protein [Pseudonocardiaceae bacterium]